ncbi:MAG: helix-turn-helix transcriptional regulator [Bauldia sp.]|nr:helix-turn-helix transcriptional regulator [Bauldia sp.]
MAQEGTFSKPGNVKVTARDEEECQTITEMLGQVGDKWTVRVVGSLGDRPLRFTELRKAVRGISQKMLTSTLRMLERDGFITRTVYPTIPPKVEYALTDLGCDLLVPVKALTEWMVDNQPRIDAARARFDGTGEAEAKKKPARGAGQASRRAAA